MPAFPPQLLTLAIEVKTVSVDHFLSLRSPLFRPPTESTARGKSSPCRCYVQLKVDHGPVSVNNIKGARYEGKRECTIRNIAVIKPNAAAPDTVAQQTG